MSKRQHKTQPELTPLQRSMLDYIRCYIAEHSWAPTNREIGTAVGGLSTSVISRHLHRLAEYGYLEMGRGPRMLRLTVKGENDANLS